MAELIEDVLELLAPWPSAHSLATTLQFESANEASTSAQLAVPLLVSGIVQRLKDPATAQGIVDLLPYVDGDGLNELEATFTSRLFEPVGTEAVNQMLGRHRQQAGDAVAEEVGCSIVSSHGVFPPMAWMVLSVIVSRHGADLNRFTLLDVVEQEEAVLLGAGWGEWMSVVAPDATVASESTAVGEVLPGGIDTVDVSSETDYPPPVTRASREPVAEAAAFTERVGERSQAVDRSEPDLGPAPPGRGPLLLGVMLVGALVGATVWYLSIRDENTRATGSRLDDTEVLVEDTDSANNAEGVDGNGAPADGSESGDAPDIAPILVSLAEPTGTRPDLVGTASLQVDVEGGRICYEIDSEGFDGAPSGVISQGEDGEQGRAIADFGRLVDTASGCVPAEPSKLAAVLDDPAGHFVSLFSPDRTVFITGQLSDPGGPRIEVAELVYAPEGDGAFAVVDGGRIALQGEVPDQQTADLLLEEFVLIGELGASDVENRLEVVAGAPNPSGRIVIQDDLLFDVGSADLARPGNSSLDLVVKFFTSRPDWQVTIIGHTDNTGSEVTNLGLSQARAEAVRDRLIELGVSGFALEAVGVGDSRPVADNDTEAGRELNRRIEFQVRFRSNG